MDSAKIKALTFDVFGTVVDWRSSITREGQALGRAKHIEADWEKFAVAWRGLYQPTLERVRSGQMPWTRLDNLHRTSLDRLVAEFHIQGLSEADLDHLNRAWHRLDPWPDAVAGLTRLKRKFILATLSNGNIALIVNMAKRAGLPWDAVVGAEVAQHYKPQPAAYLKSAEALGLAPEECMMVAAHNSDLVAASRCGLRTAFVARPTEHGPGQSTDLRAEHDFDVACSSFIELADRLGC